MKITYQTQIWIGAIVAIVCFTLAMVFKQEMVNNVGWVLYGLIWLVNPVFPTNVNPGRRGKLYMRIAGAVISLIGLTGHFGI